MWLKANIVKLSSKIDQVKMLRDYLESSLIKNFNDEGEFSPFSIQKWNESFLQIHLIKSC